MAVDSINAAVEAWEAAVLAAEARAKMGRSLQTQGMVALNSIPSVEGRMKIDLDHLETVEKLLRSATAAIGKGAQIEAEAHADLVTLRSKPPRRFEV